MAIRDGVLILGFSSTQLTKRTSRAAKAEEEKLKTQRRVRRRAKGFIRILEKKLVRARKRVNVVRRMRWKWWKKERSPKKEQVIIPMLLWTNCYSMWKSVIHVPYTTHMEDCHDMFLRCREKSCPTFCDLKDYDYFYYYYGCRQQGHPWYTLDTISRMVCLSQTGVIKRCI